MSETLNCNFYKYTGDPRIAVKNAMENGAYKYLTLLYQCNSIKPLEPLNDLEIKLIIDYPYFIDSQGKTIDRKTNLEVNGVNVYPAGLPNAGQVIPTKPFLMDANYVAFDKMWYKITSKERLTANSLAIQAEIDGILTYWTDIRNCEAIGLRSSNNKTLYIPDNKMKLNQYTLEESISLKPTQFGYNGKYVLLTVG